MSGPKISALQCTQCGAPQLEKRDGDRFVCPYCGSVYRAMGEKPAVVIRSGANVVFGKNAKVVVRGGLEIEDGANVRIDGELVLEKRASSQSIEAAKLRLERGD